MSVESINIARFEKADSASNCDVHELLTVAKEYIERDGKKGIKTTGLFISFVTEEEDGEVHYTYICAGKGVAQKQDAVALLETNKLSVWSQKVDDS